MPRVLPLVALTIACNTPSSELRILAVTPDEGPNHREQSIELETANLEFDVRVDYRHPDRSSVVGALQVFVGPHALGAPRLLGSGRVEAIVPPELPVGAYDVRLADGRGRMAVLASAYRVRAATCLDQGNCRCGDSMITGGEECDDGNTSSGDGCRADCTDEQATQACTEGEQLACPYTGPDGTEGVGICRAGVRTCASGLFGACEGEVLQSSESCDGIDEDCDRITDEGCPVGPVTYSPPIATGTVGELAPDEWAAEGCGTNEVIVGFYGRAGRFLDRIGEYCAKPGIVEDTSTVPYRYRVELSAPTAVTSRGGNGGSDFGTVCPIGQMVVGISGRADSNLITRFTFSCASFEVGPDFRLREVPGSRAPVGLEVGEFDGQPFAIPCASDAFAAKLHGAIASCCAPNVYIGTIGLSCSTMAATTR
jgi:cysteine-rich repeat protein